MEKFRFTIINPVDGYNSDLGIPVHRTDHYIHEFSNYNQNQNRKYIIICC